MAAELGRSPNSSHGWALKPVSNVAPPTRHVEDRNDRPRCSFPRPVTPPPRREFCVSVWPAAVSVTVYSPGLTSCRVLRIVRRRLQVPLHALQPGLALTAFSFAMGLPSGPVIGQRHCGRRLVLQVEVDRGAVCGIRARKVLAFAQCRGRCDTRTGAPASPRTDKPGPRQHLSAESLAAAPRPGCRCRGRAWRSPARGRADGSRGRGPPPVGRSRLQRLPASRRRRRDEQAELRADVQQVRGCAGRSGRREPGRRPAGRSPAAARSRRNPSVLNRYGPVVVVAVAVHG